MIGISPQQFQMVQLEMDRADDWFMARTGSVGGPTNIVGRKRRRKGSFTQASEVKVTKADGTVEIQPAFKSNKEIRKAVGCKETRQSTDQRELLPKR